MGLLKKLLLVSERNALKNKQASSADKLSDVNLALLSLSWCFYKAPLCFHMVAGGRLL